MSSPLTAGVPPVRMPLGDAAGAIIITDSVDAELASPAAADAVTAGTVGNPVGSAGDSAMLANIARTTFGVTGAGVTIGILSDSFNARGGYAADIADGALPAGVTVLEEGPAGGGDEGRAMAEIIHQVAPGAKLLFSSAFHSEADYASGITALAAAGAGIIVDDVTYLDEPFFQEGGAIAQAVAGVMAQGVSYFSAASNEGDTYYQSSFNGITTSLAGLPGSYQVMNFGSVAQPATTQDLTIATGAAITLDLQWDQPFRSIGGGGGAADSLGMVLYDSNGKIVASAVANRVGGDPVQVLRFTNGTGGTAFHLAIISNGGAVPPHLFKYIAYGSGVTINDPAAGIGSGTVIGHALTPGVNAVGAINAANAPALGGNGVPEAFSAYGSGAYLFDAAGNRIAAPLGTNTVGFLAPDGVATSVFSPFYGTSAAAPEAAGVAALMLQAAPGLSPAEVTTMLRQSSVAVDGPTAQVGAGLIQATTAVAAAEASAVHTAAIAPAGAFGLASPGGFSQSWVAVASMAPPVALTMREAVTALAGDPTATADLVSPGESWAVIDGASYPGIPVNAAENLAFGGATVPAGMPWMADWQVAPVGWNPPG